MKKHILSKFSKTYRYEKTNNNYYDDVTQVSYRDKSIKNFMVNKEWTSLTETVESSDPDEFTYSEKSTLTFTVENTDADELYARGWSEETRMIENSDADEFVC